MRLRVLLLLVVLIAVFPNPVVNGCQALLHGVLVLEIGNERAHFEAAFPGLEAIWLETSAGEDQVLLVTRESLASVPLAQ